MNNAHKPSKSAFHKDQNAPQSSLESARYFAGNLIQINKNPISAESESTRENNTLSKNELPQQHSSFKFYAQETQADHERDERGGQGKKMGKLERQSIWPTRLNSGAEKSSFNAGVLNCISTLQRGMRADNYGDPSRRGPEYQPIIDNSKAATPRVNQLEDGLKISKQKKIENSQLSVRFSEHQLSEYEVRKQQKSKPDHAPERQPSANIKNSIQSFFPFNFNGQGAGGIDPLPFNFNGGAGFQPLPFNFNSDGAEEEDIELPSYENTDRSRRELKTSVKSQGENMFALEHILEASSLYRNYFTKNSMLKKPSLSLPLAGLGKPEHLPKQFFYKPQRIVFCKPKDELVSDYSYNGYHMICKMNEQRTRFYYQDLKLAQLYNMKGVKGTEIGFDGQLAVSKNVEYDYFNKRFYFFSNHAQKILVYSEPTQQKLCEVKVQKRVNDPRLYIHHVNNRTFLLIVGGFCKIEKDIVQGSKFIEIFQLMRWEIQLQSRVVNLITGRISPVVLKLTEREENKILILGGYTIAKIDRKGRLNYDYQKDMNQSTNLTGLSISSHEILELFDIKEQAICYNHSVKLSNPLSLHDGCVVSLKGSFLLLLPGSRRLLQVKVFNKQVNIIEGKKCSYLPERVEFQQRQFCIRSANEAILFYTIGDQGLLQVFAPASEVQRKCNCEVY